MACAAKLSSVRSETSASQGIDPSASRAGEFFGREARAGFAPAMLKFDR
jgi:hypothetical protein